MPLSGEVILAVQLSIRGTGYAFAYGAHKLSELDLHEGLNSNEKQNELKDWIFEMPIDHIDYGVCDGRPGLATAACLPPEIAISPSQFIVALGSHDDADPEEFGDPDEVINHLLKTFCRQADANLLYEVYVVAGDDIWLLSEEDGDHDVFEASGYYNDHFKQALWGWHLGHAPTHDDHFPGFPLVRDKNFSWMTARWTLGSYTNDDLAEMMDSMSVTPPRCELTVLRLVDSLGT